MSAQQYYSMRAFDPQLLGVKVLDADCMLELTGALPADLAPERAAELEKGVKSFHGCSRNGWFCVIFERLISASGVTGLDFIFETPDERQFRRAPPDMDPEVYGVDVWYTILPPDACGAAADAITTLIQWCLENERAAADVIEGAVRDIRPAIERAHTLQWWTEVGDPEEVNERYFFCVLVTARDLLNCAASRRWMFLYEQEEPC